jgi:archaellum component FlaD/FlaE
MSSNHNEEIFTKFEIEKKSNDHQSLEEESSNSHSHNSQDIKEEHNQIEVCSKTPSSSSSSSSEEDEEEEEEKLKKKNEDEEEDGFRTPTSLDHKISVITCPQAPKKIKVQSLKRKAAGSCRQLPLDLSKEVELLFSPTHHSQSHRAKKIRRDDKEQK